MSHRFKTLLLVLGDFLCLVIALTLAVVLKKSGTPQLGYLIKHYVLFFFIFQIWFLVYFIEGLYSLKTYNPASLPISLIRANSFSTFLSLSILYIFGFDQINPKTVMIITAFLSAAFLFLWRKLFYRYFSQQERLRNTILIGTQRTLDIVQYELNRKAYLGYRITQTHLSDALELTIPEGTELVAIERSAFKNDKIYQQIFNTLGSGIEVMDLARFAERVSGKIPLQSINESWFIEYCGHSESKSFDILKNLIDRTIAILMIIALIPVAIILIPILLVVHGNPIFFKQTRTGLNNKPFTLYKLRSMVTDAEKNGAQWAKPGDARVTPLGRFLRKTRLDELPQLLNILKGEMSLVGPRPERPEIISSQLEPNIPFYKMRHLVKPGVTGWAQVTFRYGFSEEDSVEKLQYDLFYVKNRNIWLDTLVLFKTIKTVLTGAGQ